MTKVTRVHGLHPARLGHRDDLQAGCLLHTACSVQAASTASLGNRRIAVVACAPSLPMPTLAE